MKLSDFHSAGVSGPSQSVHRDFSVSWCSYIRTFNKSAQRLSRQIGRFYTRDKKYATLIKWPKISFWGPILVPEVTFWGKIPRFSHFGGSKNGTSGARIKIQRPRFNTNQPSKPPKKHIRNQNRTSKSDFWPFYQLCIFLHRFPISMHGPFFFKCEVRSPQIKKCKKTNWL